MFGLFALFGPPNVGQGNVCLAIKFQALQPTNNGNECFTLDLKQACKPPPKHYPYTTGPTDQHGSS